MRILWVVMIMAAAGCSSPPGGLDSPVPVRRLEAIAKVAKDRDQSAIPKLITFLNSDDAAVRLMSIRTLESLTGQTLGYDYSAEEWKRRQMVRAWEQWYNQRGTSPEPPARPIQQGLGPGGVFGAFCRRGGNVDTVS